MYYDVLVFFFYYLFIFSFFYVCVYTSFSFIEKKIDKWYLPSCICLNKRVYLNIPRIKNNNSQANEKITQQKMSLIFKIILESCFIIRNTLMTFFSTKSFYNGLLLLLTIFFFLLKRILNKNRFLLRSNFILLSRPLVVISKSREKKENSYEVRNN